jgi:hypothetical protein
MLRVVDVKKSEDDRDLPPAAVRAQILPLYEYERKDLIIDPIAYFKKCLSVSFIAGVKAIRTINGSSPLFLAA